MTANHNELLSALVDGMLAGEELNQALELLNTNEQARLQFQRYQHASDTLHGHSLSNVDLSSQISQTLKYIDFDSQDEKKKARVFQFPKQFWRQTAGLAVAASMGALAMVGVISQPENQLVPAVQVATLSSVPSQLASQVGKRWTVEGNDVEKRLNAYLVDHNEYTGAADVYSYARVISYDVGQ